MEGTRAAARYAKSFLELALEKGQLEKAYADMKYIADVCRNNHEFTVFLKSPIIKTDKKQSVLKAVLGGNIDKITESFIQLITAKKREMYLPGIAEEFMNQYNQKKQILKAVVTTASGIDEATRKQVLDLIKGTGENAVVLEEKIDKNIIGGIIIRVGDKQIDASIARKLNDLKRDFKESPFVKKF
jgi:F-type H+-transporting ATPase subunit delta